MCVDIDADRRGPGGERELPDTEVSATPWRKNDDRRSNLEVASTNVTAIHVDAPPAASHRCGSYGQCSAPHAAHHGTTSLPHTR
jgi:hypothetical protein